ncbi:MAG: NAD(P)/FAD-dependent oxidoreductase [Chitinophagales bacterium]
MIVRVRSLKLQLDQEESLLPSLAAKKLGISVDQLDELEIVRKSLDARRTTVHFVYTVDVDLLPKVKLPREVLDSPEISIVQARPPVAPVPGETRLPSPPVIIGAGPAGLFCGLLLARHGYKPVIIERGRDVDRRIKDVELFWEQGILDPESNVQFGEGGAGTFSDGKLTTRIDDDRVDLVLKTMVEFGAPPEIIYEKRPHVGTDRLREIIKKIRGEILSHGGKIYFQARATDFLFEDDRMKGLVINDQLKIDSPVAVLATGNSARDVYRALNHWGVPLVVKGFAVGVRIEHPQALIDQIQYGDYAGHPKLPPADYQITYQDLETGRALYTFCMCPGGQIIAGASEEGRVVTNGMSLYARDSGQANSALVVTVSPENLEEDNPLAGVEFQEMLEARAYQAGGGGFKAPVQRVQDFLTRQASVEAESSYRPGNTPANLWEVLPPQICGVIARGLRKINQKMPGFVSPEAVLVGVETRTSSPIRVVRGPERVSTKIDGLYPCGEGAGYAGGIVSAAVDGLKVAESIIARYARPQKTLEIEHPDIIKADPPIV